MPDAIPKSGCTGQQTSTAATGAARMETEAAARSTTVSLADIVKID
ncbi:hypothetical protein [Bradyrhizobium arachidis]|nr:hypothetical protein [Bradyrhizobium arachidis]